MFRVIIGLIAAFVLYLGVEGVAWLFHSYEYVGNATVLQLVYTPSSTSTGTGVAPTGDGDVGVVVITQTTPEKFVALVNLNNDALSINVSSKQFANLKKDQEVGVYRRTGIFLYSTKVGDTR